MMDRDKRLTGHKRGQVVRPSSPLLSASCDITVSPVFLSRRSRMLPTTSRPIVYGTPRGHHESRMQSSTISLAIDCAQALPQCQNEKRQLSISVLSHSNISVARSLCWASNIRLSSSEPYFCPSSLTTRSARIVLVSSSASPASLMSHWRRTPCFERSCADYARHQPKVSYSWIMKTYHAAPREGSFNIVRELWCLPERPIPCLQLHHQE